LAVMAVMLTSTTSAFAQIVGDPFGSIRSGAGRQAPPPAYEQPQPEERGYERRSDRGYDRRDDRGYDRGSDSRGYDPAMTNIFWGDGVKPDSAFNRARLLRCRSWRLTVGWASRGLAHRRAS
jgi:hypothetical protein